MLKFLMLFKIVYSAQITSIHAGESRWGKWKVRSGRRLLALFLSFYLYRSLNVKQR